MDFVEIFIKFFDQSADRTKERTPPGICPVCWGYQEYDHQIRKVFKDKQIDVNNHLARRMIIQEFIVNHLDGIKLKDTEMEQCPTCRKKTETGS